MDRQCSSCGGFCKKSGCERENVQPEQTPVAWITKGGTGELWWSQSVDEEGNPNPDDVPLYTAPPQREWQSVGTDAEILELSKDAWGREELKYGRTDHTQFYIDFARAIETKLKEKNVS